MLNNIYLILNFNKFLTSNIPINYILTNFPTHPLNKEKLRWAQKKCNRELEDKTMADWPCLDCFFFLFPATVVLVPNPLNPIDGELDDESLGWK